ncbi:hypothetical protein IWZ01DRAFT_499208 [Phyllosticta capitalensis]
MVVEARGLRSSSRRTPQPALLSAASADPRATRSRSQDINPMRQTSPPQRTTRGQARAASVESALSTGSVPRVSRRTAKQAAAVPELPTVEEDAVSLRQSLAEPPATDGHTSPGITIFPSAQLEPEHQPEGSPGARSNGSGSPISNPETLNPPSDLDVVLMVDTLEDLHADSNKVLEKISPRNATHAQLRSIYSDVRKPGSNVNRILANRLKRFDNTRSAYGTEEYISCKTVNDAFTEHAPYGIPPPRTDAILQKANLASLAREMISLEREKSETWDILLRLDNTFPCNFLSWFYDDDLDATPVGASGLVEETFSLALEIRTQFLIRLLLQKQDETDFWPHQELLEVFCNPSEDGHQLEAGRQSLRGWNMPGLVSDEEELPPRFERLVSEQIDRIRKCLPDQEDGIEDVDFELLEAEFPWTHFIIKLLEWISKREQETEAEISRLGGVEAIKNDLQEHIEPPKNQATQTYEHLSHENVEPPENHFTQTPGPFSQENIEPSENQATETSKHLSQENVEPSEDQATETSKHLSQENVEPSEDQATQASKPLSQKQPVEPKPQPRKQFAPPNPGVISVLKKRIARLSGGQTREEAGTALQPRQPRQPEDEDDWQPLANEDEDISATAVEIQEPPPYASKQGAMEQLRRIERQNKENILRVQNEKAKRSIFERQPDALRVSFDEDGIRNSPVKRRDAPSQSPAKRRRVDEDYDEEEEEFETDYRQPSSQRRREGPAKRRRITPAPRRATSIASSRGQRFDGGEDVGDETVVEDVEDVSRLARRQGTVIPPVTNAGGKRKRFPWTEEEDQQLIALYRVYGGGKQPWKRIKEADEADLNILHRRDPVALKDRARNLCFIYDKSNTGRPDVLEGLDIGEFYRRKVNQKLGRLPSEVPVD